MQTSIDGYKLGMKPTPPRMSLEEENRLLREHIKMMEEIAKLREENSKLKLPSRIDKPTWDMFQGGGCTLLS